MKMQPMMWVWLVVLSVSAVGCGDGGDPAADNARPSKEKPAPPVGAVVIEPSEPTITIAGEARPTLDVVRELIADEPSPAPEGYAVQFDDGFNTKGRLRFVVEPAESQGDEAVKQAAAQAFDTLAQAFSDAMQSALRDELVSAGQALDTAHVERKAAQEALRSYSANRSGLSPTKASRLETRRLELRLEEALKHQSALAERIKAMENQLERERWPTLRRIK